MTVQELIKRLQALKQDANVVLGDDSDMTVTALTGVGPLEDAVPPELQGDVPQYDTVMLSGRFTHLQVTSSLDVCDGFIGALLSGAVVVNEKLLDDTEES